jgi:hypothetical protein
MTGIIVVFVVLILAVFVLGALWRCAVERGKSAAEDADNLRETLDATRKGYEQRLAELTRANAELQEAGENAERERRALASADNGALKERANGLFGGGAGGSAASGAAGKPPDGKKRASRSRRKAGADDAEKSGDGAGGVGGLPQQ